MAKDARVEKYATALRNFSTDSSISFSQEQRTTVSDIADYIQNPNPNKSFWSIFSFFSIFSVSEWAWWVKTYVLTNCLFSRIDLSCYGSDTCLTYGIIWFILDRDL